MTRFSRFVSITVDPPVSRDQHRNLVDAAIAEGQFHDLDREIFRAGYVRGWCRTTKQFPEACSRHHENQDTDLQGLRYSNYYIFEELGMINRQIFNAGIHFGVMLKLICLTVILQVMMASALLNGNAWAGSWQSIQAGGMSVELYVPATAPKLENKRALMISLHGCVQTNTMLRDHGNWSDTADEYGMVVALPAVPDGGKIAGCWDYYGRTWPILPPLPPHTRNSRDNDNLLALVETLQSDASLNIDPSQTYIAGLSSGGGQALVMGCLAPEIFAGMGINAAPTIGTGSHEINPPANVSLPITLKEAKGFCESLAGSHAPAFATQLASVIYGSDDRIVDLRYNKLNAEVMTSIYGISDKSGFPVNELPGHNPRGAGEFWSDSTGPRFSLIRNDGLGHAWPSGSGPGGEINFVAQEGVNYPAYVTRFFFENNRRVHKNPPLLFQTLLKLKK